jgi:hypothetical protein
MQYARCLNTNAIYTAEQFSGMTPSALAQMRQNLVCPECGGPGFFRNKSHNGRDACFGAWPHAEACKLRAAPTAAKDKDQAQASANWINAGTRLVIDFGYGAPAPMDWTGHGSALDNGRGREEPQASFGLSTHSVQHMRLRPLLRSLIAPTPFSTSQQLVDVAGIGTVKAVDFFVPFEALEDWHGGRYLGCYGRVAFADWVTGSQTLWLNSGGYGDPSICVPVRLVPGLIDRFGIDDLADLEHAHVLAFGAVQTSQFGKKYVVLDDLNRITIDLARDR